MTKKTLNNNNYNNHNNKTNNKRKNNNKNEGQRGEPEGAAPRPLPLVYLVKRGLGEHAGAPV